MPAAHSVCVRASLITAVEPGVRVLAVYDGHPVAVADDTTLATAIHPELTGDDRWHRAFVECCRGDRSTREPVAAAREARNA